MDVWMPRRWIYEQTNGWMDERVDEWMNTCIYERADGWKDEVVDDWTNRCIYERADGWKGERVDDWKNRWINERTGRLTDERLEVLLSVLHTQASRYVESGDCRQMTREPKGRQTNE